MTDKTPPRWRTPLLFVLATAPIGMFVFIFLFMGRYHNAFDDETCPFEQVEVRSIEPGVYVREDERACEPAMEEHRWVLLREGRRELELGRRPLAREAYGEGYRWTAQNESGRVRVEIHNPGVENSRMFREPVPEAGLADY